MILLTVMQAKEEESWEFGIDNVDYAEICSTVAVEDQCCKAAKSVKT